MWVWSISFKNKIELFQKTLKSCPINKSLNKKPANIDPITKQANGKRITISES